MPDELSAPEVEVPASAPETAQPEVEAPQAQGSEQHDSPDPLEAIWEKHQDGEKAAAPDSPAAPDAKPVNRDSEQKQPDPAQAAPVTPQAEQKLKAPHTWTKEEQAAFDAAPADVQKAIFRRAEQVEQLAQESLGARQFAQTMRPIGEMFADPEVAGFLKTLQLPDGSRLWGNPQAMAGEMRELIQLKRTLIENPAEGLRQITQYLRQYGLDPAQPAQADDGQQESPESAALRRELAQIKARIAQQDQQARENAEQAQRQTAAQHIARSINSLASTTDAQGQPAYPHLAGEHSHEVGDMMGRFMRANAGPEGITPELFKSAYETAVFAHPALREAEFKAREARRVAEFKERSERARKAAGTRPAPGGPATDTDKMTPQEALEAVWARHHST